MALAIWSIQRMGLDEFLPTVVFGRAGLYLIWDGIRYETVFGKVVLPFLGIVLFALAVLFTFPGVNDFVQGPFWFLLKVLTFLFIYVWLRGTLPRFRYDQLMAVGWKLLLPLSIANVVLTSLAIVRFSR